MIRKKHDFFKNNYVRSAIEIFEVLEDFETFEDIGDIYLMIPEPKKARTLQVTKNLTAGCLEFRKHRTSSSDQGTPLPTAIRNLFEVKTSESPDSYVRLGEYMKYTCYYSIY